MALVQSPTSVAAMSGSCGVVEAEIQKFAQQMLANMGQTDPATGACVHRFPSRAWSALIVWICRPKMLPAASMKRMKACQDAKAALQSKVGNGELTMQGYVESLGAMMKRDQKLVQALKALKREDELKQVAERYALIKQEKAAVEADM